MTPADTSSVPSHPLIESDHIEGTAVYDANGKQIGTIKRLVIEKVSGHVFMPSARLAASWAWVPRPVDPVGAAAFRHRSAWVQNQHRGGAAAQSARVLPG